MASSTSDPGQHQNPYRDPFYLSATEGTALLVPSQIQGSQSNTSSSRSDSRGKPVYSHYHKPGHTRDKCFRLVSFPPGWTPKGKGKQTGAQAMQASSGNAADTSSVRQEGPMQPIGPGNFAGLFGAIGQNPTHFGPSSPQAFYPGYGPAPLTPGPLHFGTQGGPGLQLNHGQQPISYGPSIAAHDQPTGGNSGPNQPFAGLMMQPPIGSPNPPLSLAQLQNMLEQLHMWPSANPASLEGRFAGPFDWAGDQTG